MTTLLTDLSRNTLADYFPSGCWGYVGRVYPMLAYVNYDGSEIADLRAIRVAVKYGPSFAGVRTRSFDTPLDALYAAKRLGQKVTIPATLFRKMGLAPVVRLLGLPYDVC